jgi:hypothetical protein
VNRQRWPGASIVHTRDALARDVQRIERPEAAVTVYLLEPNYNRQHALDLIAALRRQNPDAAISLDPCGRITVRE